MNWDLGNPTLDTSVLKAKFIMMESIHCPTGLDSRSCSDKITSRSGTPSNQNSSFDSYCCSATIVFQVGAVRVDPATVQEAVIGMARQCQAQEGLTAPTPLQPICEDIFVSQLSSRAALLNNAFQQAVSGVIRRHSAVVNETGFTAEPSPISEGVQLKCDHSLRVSTIFCCEFTQGMDFVEVHPAPVKTVTRMRTKLTE